jgi:plastocyanin
MSSIFTRSMAVGLWLAAFAPAFAAAGDHVIVQKDKQFSQTTIKIKKGDSISFKNEEKDITHNVFSLGPKNEFELKVQAPGTSSTVSFKDAGTTSIECAIHPAMKLNVTVE